jgi:hypothetical protein
MVKVHPFTVLCDLLREPNSEVKDIFKECAVKTAPQQRQTSSPMLEMIVAKEPMNKDVAKQRMDDLLARISNCGDNYFAVFQEMSKVLTTDGIGRLLVMLKGNLPDEFLKNDKIQYLFKGMPIFKVIVEQSRFVRSKTDGWYDIILEHTGTGEQTLMKFETRPSKALYLLFLLMPREKIFQMSKYRKTLQDLLNNAFDIKERKEKKDKEEDIDKEEKEEKEDKRKRKPLDEIFEDAESFADALKQIMSSSRRSVEKAISDRDDLAWYVIDYDRSDYYYSLSLPEEMIDLSQAPSLVEFRDKYLSK